MRRHRTARESGEKLGTKAIAAGSGSGMEA
jgi:hypothetical protein